MHQGFVHWPSGSSHVADFREAGFQNNLRVVWPDRRRFGRILRCECVNEGHADNQERQEQRRRHDNGRTTPAAKERPAAQCSDSCGIIGISVLLRSSDP